MAEITKFRYPGAKNFTTEQAHLFMGRDDDKEKLYQMIAARQVVVLYGKSGMGKSSLLNAGIIPLLENELSQKPKYFSVRLFNKGQEKNASFVPPLQTLIKTVSENATEKEWLKPLKADAYPKGELWYWLKQWQIAYPRVPIILFFDQFEELFSYSDTEIEEFGEELRTLIYQNIPDYISKGKSLTAFEQMAFAQQNEKDREEKEKQIDAIYEKIDIKLVFSIRSDRMALLNKLTRYIPSILKHFYELDALTEEAAKEAIKIPAQIEGDFQTPTFQYEDKVVDAIIERVKNKHDGKIETATLQIILRFIEEQKVLRDKNLTITSEGLGDIKDIFEATYKSILESFPLYQKLEISQIIEKYFIQNERRIPFAEEHLIKNYKLTDKILAELEKSSLLRKERDHAGRYIYEIGHDTWIEPILELKKKKEENVETQSRLGEEVLKSIREKIPLIISAIKENRCLLVLGTELCKFKDIERYGTPKDFHQSLEFQYEHFLESDEFKKNDFYVRDYENYKNLISSINDTVNASNFSQNTINISEDWVLSTLLSDFMKWYFKKSDNWKEAYSKIVNMPFPLIFSLLPDDSFEKMYTEKFKDQSLNIIHYSRLNLDIVGIKEKPTPQKPILCKLSGDLEYGNAIFTFEEWAEFFKGVFSYYEFPPQIVTMLRDNPLIVFLGVKSEKWNIQLLINFLLSKNSKRFSRSQLVFDENSPDIFLQELHEACSKEELLKINIKTSNISKEDLLKSSIKTSSIYKDIKVFITYNHVDTEIAHRLKRDLEYVGFTVIIDTDIPIGFDFTTYINQSFNNADFILQLISENFLSSIWVTKESIRTFIEAEITGKVVLPCEIDDILRNDEFRTEVMTKLKVQLEDLEYKIENRRKRGYDIEDLSTQYQRILELKYNHYDVIDMFMRKKRGDLRGNNYEVGLKQIIKSIEVYQSRNE